MNLIHTRNICNNVYNQNRLENDDYFTSIIDKAFDKIRDSTIRSYMPIYKEKLRIKEDGWCKVLGRYRMLQKWIMMDFLDDLTINIRQR